MGLMLTALVLCLTSFGVQFYAHVLVPEFALPSFSYFHPEDEEGIDLLDVDEEDNIPAWFSSSVLILCSVLLAVITSAAKKAYERYVLHWATMSIIFVVLSMDEAAYAHERFNEPLRSFLDTGGILYFAWVIPGGALVIVFVLAYLRFLLSLPTETRRLFVAAGALYVSGAVGLEMLGGLQADLYDESNLTYAALVTAEEFLEMTGAILFLYALMRYTGHLGKAGRVQVEAPQSPRHG
jgi:hypothetical protein